jgi:hypothetical protein
MWKFYSKQCKHLFLRCASCCVLNDLLRCIRSCARPALGILSCELNIGFLCLHDTSVASTCSPCSMHSLHVNGIAPLALLPGCTLCVLACFLCFKVYNYFMSATMQPYACLRTCSACIKKFISSIMNCLHALHVFIFFYYMIILGHAPHVCMTFLYNLYITFYGCSLYNFFVNGCGHTSMVFSCLRCKLRSRPHPACRHMLGSHANLKICIAPCSRWF